MAEYIDVDKLQKEFEMVCVGECDCCKEASCPVYTQPLIKAIPLDKVKKAREEIKKEINTPICGEYIKQGHDWGLREALKILDKLIESEE